MNRMTKEKILQQITILSFSSKDNIKSLTNDSSWSNGKNRHSLEMFSALELHTCVFIV